VTHEIHKHWSPTNNDDSTVYLSSDNPVRLYDEVRSIDLLIIPLHNAHHNEETVDADLGTFIY
jgi:hypothetical protein